MKITLRRVIMCGLALLTPIFFLIGCGLDVTYAATALGITTKKSASLFSYFNYSGKVEDYGKHPFDEVMAQKLLNNGYKDNVFKRAVADQAAFKTLAVIMLILCIVAILAVLGAFFFKKDSSARKLMIPVLGVSLVAFIVCVFGLWGATLAGKTWKTTSDGDPVAWMFVVGVVTFIASIVVPFFFKDKELVTLGKK